MASKKTAYTTANDKGKNGNAVAEIEKHGFVLTPGRYVGTEEVVDDGEPFAEKMPRLVSAFYAQFDESAKRETAIRANLKGIGYGN